jgi:16S rRNA (guanine1516-N2)-methyltransferase
MSAQSRDGYTIERIDGRLALCARDAGARVYLDLDDVQRRLRQGKKLALAKACGVRPGLRVLDGMAGLGLDGITLAMLGCDVLMVERDPQLFVLLQDAIARARADVSFALSIECREGDVRDLLAGRDEFDTLYLDPMFPPRDKAALPRKSAQVLGELLGASDEDLRELVAAATARARGRVVVKRRRHDATWLQPDWQIVGRSVRFDVYRGTARSAAG